MFNEYKPSHVAFSEEDFVTRAMHRQFPALSEEHHTLRFPAPPFSGPHFHCDKSFPISSLLPIYGLHLHVGDTEQNGYVLTL